LRMVRTCFGEACYGPCQYHRHMLKLSLPKRFLPERKSELNRFISL
jgi:hypothetical protein